MATSKKYPKQFNTDCHPETRALFDKIKERHGFKTNAEAFSAVVYTCAHSGILDPQQQNRIEAIVLRILEWHEGEA